MLTGGFTVPTINAMKIEFDVAKYASNQKKHGVSLGDAAKLDWDTATVCGDMRRDYDEYREIGYGLIEARLYCVVFVRRGEAFRIISLRKTNQQEVNDYEKTHLPDGG